MSSVVAEKQFVWRFIDKVTEGANKAKQAMESAKNAAKQAGVDVKESSSNWGNYGNEAKEAADKANSAVKQAANTTRDSMDKAKESIDKVNGTIRQIPSGKTFNLKAKFDDNKLRTFSREVHDVPKEKSTWMRVKDGFSSQLKNAQNEANHTQQSFSHLKEIMAGTFVGGAILNGIYAIGNGLKEAAGAGMQFDTEQQKMLATWHTLTGSAGQAKGMVDTINDLSIKTGQATDTINELEQGFYHLHSSKGEADDMTKAMLNMGDAVGLSGQQLTQVEQDMVHGLATGKVTQGELNQIGMYFPMIDERMAKHFHTTVAGMRQMASAGKITGKDLEEVFEQMGNSGKYKHAVDNMMQTTWGSMRTIRSMVPRLVGSLEQGLFAARNPLVGAVAKWTTDPAAKRSFTNFGRQAASVINDALDAVMKLGEAFAPLNRLIGSALGGLASGIWTGFSITIRGIATALATATNAIAKFTSSLFGVKSGNSVLQGTHDAFKILGTVIGTVVAILGTYKAVLTTVKAVEAVWNATTKAAIAVQTAWKAATQASTVAQTELNTAMKLNPIGLVVIAITALVGGLILAYKHINPFREAVDRLGASIKRAFTGNAGWEKDIAKQFQALNKAFDRDGKAFQKKMANLNKSIWKGLTGNAGWEKDIKKAFSNAQKDYDRYSKQQLKSEQIMQRERQKNWNNFWNGLSKNAWNAWNTIAKHASNGMQNVRKNVATHSAGLHQVWSNTWSTMQRITVSAWQTIRSHSSSGMSRVQSAISNGMSTIGHVWNSGWTSFANFFKGIWSGIKQAAADGMNGVINVINAAIGGINKVWSFFTGHGTGLSAIGHVHYASGGVVRRHLSVINDGTGPDWKELVQTPDGGLYMSQQRNWTGFLPEGTRVYSGPETRRIMNSVGISHYADGGIVGDVEEGIDWAKGSLDNLASWMGDKIEAITDFLDDPLKAVQGLIKKATSGMAEKLGHYGEIATGALEKLTKPIADWFKKKLEPILEKLEQANPGGAGVARWRPYIIRAFHALGIAPAEWKVNKLLRQIQTESGGNPVIWQQVHDVNSGGNEARGLLQFAGSTWAADALPGHTDWRSGYNEILAAINVLEHGGEGGWGNVGNGHGWATGGEITSQQFGWVGDNPEHHEFVLNPYAASAEPLLDRAFEATADAQPSGQTTPQGSGSKMDRMIQLLEILVANVEGLDLNVELDGDSIVKYTDKTNAKIYGMLKGR